MARHIVAVCLICLLYLNHLSCQQAINSDNHAYFAITLNGVDENSSLIIIRKEIDERNTEIEAFNNREHRTKRHAHHDRDKHNDDTVDHMPELTRRFLQSIFFEYGTNNGTTLTISSFQNLLKSLGLNKLLLQQQNNYHSTKIGLARESAADDDTCIDGSTLLHWVQAKQEHNAKAGGKLSSDFNCAECKAKEEVDDVGDLSQADVVHLCPVLLYQLASADDSMRAGCINRSVIIDLIDRKNQQAADKEENLLIVWIYAFIAVLACSILGLVGVAIIPFMDSRYYKHIIQFLVALAVGTMTGDALLHLLPHSLRDQSEQQMIYKGLVCMSGILFFYVTEHGLTMISEWRKSKAKQEKNNPNWSAKILRETDESSHHHHYNHHVQTNATSAGNRDKVCKSKYSSYPYCYDEIAMDMLHDGWLHLPKNTNNPNKIHDGGAGDAGCEAEICTGEAAKAVDPSVSIFDRKRNGKSIILGNHIDHTELSAKQSLLPTATSPPTATTINNGGKKNHNCQGKRLNGESLVESIDENNAASSIIDNNRRNLTLQHELLESLPKEQQPMQQQQEPVTVILREHEATHHGHSHKHGHVHSPPATLSAVAWMIIMGDGLHNFTDGMAIGAAFAENIAGGFSTALAVFCHELPHELGDFAILMKAGMSVKSAVYYNLLTGVLSFIGMIFGIVFGQSQETAQWIFAAAAGLFIYIALVDMMPEISAAHKSIYEFLLQILGISSGVALMLLIAIYEGDLINVFPSK